MELLRDAARVRCHRPVLTYHLYKRLGGNAVGSQNATLRDSSTSAMQQRSEVAGDLPSASIVESGHQFEVEEACPADGSKDKSNNNSRGDAKVAIEFDIVSLQRPNESSFSEAYQPDELPHSFTSSMIDEIQLNSRNSELPDQREDYIALTNGRAVLDTQNPDAYEPSVSEVRENNISASLRCCIREQEDTSVDHALSPAHDDKSFPNPNPREASTCGRRKRRKDSGGILFSSESNDNHQIDAKTKSCSPVRHQKPSSQSSNSCDGRSVNSDKQHSCIDCRKVFSYRSQLIRHRQIHNGEKPYSCDDCGKSFTDSSALVKHRLTHTGEKPYSCADCGKSFAVSSKLVTHRRIHSGEKPYSCDDCGKSFTQSSHLITHRRVHTGMKPYSCVDCGKSFTDSSNLRSHSRIHIG